LSHILAIRSGVSWPKNEAAVISTGIAPSLSEHVVIIGHGPTGKTITRLLRDNNISSTIIELNLDTSRRLTQSGLKVIYGDATKRDTLEKAGLAKANTLIISTTTMTSPQEVVERAKEINPNIKIIAGTNFIRDLLDLKQFGLRQVFAGEGEVALAILEALLKDLGATEEQIQRERVRFHNELLENPPKV
jgi:CPA2 family monovalent cation:H+ antiporter-2